MPTEYKLDEQKILELLNTDEFYQHVPEFLFLREEARRVIDNYKAEFEKGGCTDCKKRKILGPLVTIFRGHLVKLYNVCGSTGVSRFIAYISSQLKYHPQPIKMKYLSADGKTSRTLVM